MTAAELDILKPEPHPLLAPHTVAEAERWFAALPLLPAEAQEQQVKSLLERRDTITRAQWDEVNPLVTDPYQDGLELPHWLDADFVLGLGERTLDQLALIQANWARQTYTEHFPPAMREMLGKLPAGLLSMQFLLLVLLGGNRSGKSEYCARRCVQSAMKFPGSTIICVAGEDMDQSIQNQQALIWKYLPLEYKMLNGERDKKGVFHINYSLKGGFTLEQLILPNGSKFLFYASRTQEAGVLEGKKPGHPWRAGVLGFWGDESVRLPWMLKLMTRAGYQQARGLWSFTPIDGMTHSIKEVVGTAQTLMQLPAEFLGQERRHVADCRPGWMPYIQKARTPQTVVMYFHTQLSPFGAGRGNDFRSYYDQLKTMYAGKPDNIKAKFAYGYTEDTSERTFPAWGPQNVVKMADVPEAGTLRLFIDPHGDRPYAMIKVLTTPGKSPEHYIVGDWPDEEHHGCWAEASTAAPVSGASRKGLDGKKGQAQKPNGWAALQYKMMLRNWAAIEVPAALQQWLRKAPKRVDVKSDELRDLLKRVRCPWWRPRLREAIAGGWRGDTVLHEEIFETFMDPRAAAVELEQGDEKLSLQEIWESEQVHGATGETFDAITITPASGRPLKHGYKLVTDLLAWDKEHPDGCVRHINAPRLYAVEEATQFRWAMENFTNGGGLGDQDGACKEWPDLARHLAEAEPYHVTDTTFQCRNARDIDDHHDDA